jgi:hypothetical protein
MPRPLRRRPKPDRRRALELLASCRDGCTETMMLAHGFSIDMMVKLVNAGLANVTGECVVAGGKTIEVARVRITEAGGGRLQGMTRTSQGCNHTPSSTDSTDRIFGRS